MKPLPPLPALRAFEAVSRLGSMVRAANELHVTHSAISHQIKALEADLGVALFERRGKRLLATEEGRVYAVQIRNALHDLAAATELVLSRPRPDELVISVIPSFGTHWLLPRLPRFQARFPDYRVRLRASLAVDDLNTGVVDVAIRMGVGGWPVAQVTRLMGDTLLAVAAPHFNAGDLPRDIASFLRAPFIRSIENGRAWLQAAGVEGDLPQGLDCNDSNLLLQAVLLGQGVALARRSITDALLREGRLLQLLPIEVPFDRDYWLAWPQRSEGSRKLADFCAWLQEEVSVYQQGLPPLADQRRRDVDR